MAHHLADNRMIIMVCLLHANIFAIRGISGGASRDFPDLQIPEILEIVVQCFR